jgi:hypothetical protein
MRMVETSTITPQSPKITTTLSMIDARHCYDLDQQDIIREALKRHKERTYHRKKILTYSEFRDEPEFVPMYAEIPEYNRAPKESFWSIIKGIFAL